MAYDTPCEGKIQGGGIYFRNKVLFNHMIYVFDSMPDFTDEQYHRLLPLLSAERRKKAERFRSMGAKKLCAAAYLLLVYGMEREYGLRGPFDFTCNEQGKPYLKDHPHIHFNISHCRHGAACAVFDREVGLDMQDISHFTPTLERYVCGDAEWAKLQQSQTPDRDFCRLWVQKESILKLRGTGISGDLKQVLQEQNRQTIQSFFFDSPPAQNPYMICCSFFEPPEELPKVLSPVDIRLLLS
jgi:4'-phosphopantetheinyl transferase